MGHDRLFERIGDVESCETEQLRAGKYVTDWRSPGPSMRGVDKRVCVVQALPAALRHVHAGRTGPLDVLADQADQYRSERRPGRGPVQLNAGRMNQRHESLLPRRKARQRSPGSTAIVECPRPQDHWKHFVRTG